MQRINSSSQCLRNSFPTLSSRMYSSKLERSFDNYLQLSKLPTLTFQDSLPSLPIPKVEDSAPRYAKAVLPLYSNDPAKQQQIQTLINEFEKSSEIAKIQKILKETAPKGSSFISKPWFDTYLEARAPLPLNYNPFISFLNDPRPEGNDQVHRTACYLNAIVRFRNSLRDQTLSPEVFYTKPEKKDLIHSVIPFIPKPFKWYGGFAFGAYALDMSQYARLFSSTRIPKKGKDVLSELEETQHVAVLCNKQFWTLPVANSQGAPLPRPEIMKGLQDILQKSKQSAPETPIAALSSEDRDIWANVREEMEKSQKNRASFKALDSAICLICLDDQHPEKLEDLYRSFLIGDGDNRWFDKSFSLIFTPKGQASINFEHSWGDGVAIVRLLSDLYEDTIKQQILTAASSTNSPPQKLEWELSDSVKKSVQQAKKKFDVASASVFFNFHKEEGFGKSDIKKSKLSPDGVMQMAFQLAYGLVTNGTKIAPTYESASTAGFKHGRTETIRPVSNESVQMVKTFLSTQDHNERFSALKSAITVHSERISQALTGKGWDRHLFALKKIASEQGLKVGLFEDESYKFYHHNILSTSTLSAAGMEYGGFGPVVDDGLGVGYAVESSYVGANVSSYGNHSADFVQAFQKSLELIKQTLASQAKA